MLGSEAGNIRRNRNCPGWIAILFGTAGLMRPGL
jgi:hypothetical protein